MKISKILAIAGILSLAAANSALAATFTDSGTGTTGSPSVSVKPSKNVTVVYTPSGTASGTGVITYSIASSHSSGTKTIGSSSGDTKIFMIDGVGTAPLTAPAAGASAGYEGANWTAM